MTLRQPIQISLRAKNSGLLLETKRLRKLVVSALIASSVTLAGCQQMGFRSRTDELKQMMAEQDDWALPQSSQSRVPRPNVSRVVDRKRSDTTDRLASDDGEESVRRSSQQSRNREYRNSTDEDENDSECQQDHREPE